MPSSTASDPYIGRTFGNVRLTAKIGQGGMGMVYRGWHDRFARDVAVKLLPIGRVSDNEQFLKRFIREGRAAARIQHRNVVRVMDAGNDAGISYLVLELVDGSSLGDIIDRKGRLAPDMVERLGRGIAEGLVAIHKVGIVHRDIKPDNVLLGRDGVVKITDLGLARQMDDETANRLTATGMVVGTPLYVSPEAIRDTKDAGPSADIYSLGATLYHMLVGRPPFSGKTAYEVMRAHLDKRLQPIREQVPEVPPPLADLVERCLAKLPAERPDLETIRQVMHGRTESYEVQGKRGSLLIPIGVVLVAVIGVASWVGLQYFDIAGETAPAHAGRLQFAIGRQLEWRPAEGDWQAVPAGGLLLAPGEQVVELRTVDLGPRYRARYEGQVIADQEQQLHLDWQAQRLDPVFIALPEVSTGLVYLNGQCQASGGNDLAIDRVGHHAIGRWDPLGRRAWSSTVRLQPDATLLEDAWEEGPRPSGAAFFRSQVDNRRTPRHHLVCWQEVELARSHYPDVAAPRSFTGGAGRPTQPAEGLDTSLVKALLKAANEHWHCHWRLPTAAEGDRLQEAYGVPVWTDDGTGLRPGRGHSPSQAWLLVLER